MPREQEEKMKFQVLTAYIQHLWGILAKTKEHNKDTIYKDGNRVRKKQYELGLDMGEEKRRILTALDLKGKRRGSITAKNGHRIVVWLSEEKHDQLLSGKNQGTLGPIFALLLLFRSCSCHPLAAQHGGRGKESHWCYPDRWAFQDQTRVEMIVSGGAKRKCPE